MKKISIFVFGFVLFFLSSGFFFSAFAQQSNCPVWASSQECLEYDDKPNLGSMQLFTYTTAGTLILDSTIGRRVPVTNSSGQIIRYTNTGGGVVGKIGLLTMGMVQQPGGGTSTSEWLAYMGDSLNIIQKPAYAQGAAFAGLSPILIAWQIVANVAYIAYVVVFFVVGFMILLRRKIDPRTVISIESALPKLIISLILITFSYAIIAFLIDITNLVSQLIARVFIGTGRLVDPDPGIQSLNEFISNLFANNVFTLVRAIGDTTNIETAIGDISGGPWGALAILGGLSTKVIFALATLFIEFKIFFALLTPYVQIVLAVIFAPFELLMMAFPGSENNVGTWLKNIVSKLAVFPATLLMIILAASFGAYNPQNHWLCKNSPSFCFNWWQNNNSAFLKNIPDLNITLAPFGNWGGAVGALISFGILLTIPSVVEMVQAAFKVKDQSGAMAGQKVMQSLSKLPLIGNIAK